jgi:hypothetical protein
MTRHLSGSLLFGFAFLAAAQTQHITAFTGTWRFNVAKSEFNPGLPFKSFTLTFAPDGVRHLDLIPANGQPFRAELPWSDGKEVSVVVKEGSTGNVQAVSKIKGKTFDDTWRENDKVIEKVHGVLSADGETLTVTVEGPTQQGGTFHNRVVFDKQ